MLFCIKYVLNIEFIIMIKIVSVVKNFMCFILLFLNNFLFNKYNISVVVNIFKDIEIGVLKFIKGVNINDSGIIMFNFINFLSILNICFLCGI